MSVELKQTRGELYKEYKQNNNSIAAKKILGKKYSSARTWMDGGGAFLITAIITSAFFLSVIAGVTHGFGPVPNHSFYPFVSSLTCVLVGLSAQAGLILLIIGYIKERAILDEPLSELDVDNIIGEPLKEVNEL